MRLALIVLLAAPLAVFADNRLEVGNANGGGHCHVVWDQDNQDNEHKLNCQVFSIQHPDGTYTATAKDVWYDIERSLVDAPLPAAHKFNVVYESNCTETAGTFQDDDGNAYTSNDCTAAVTYKARPRQVRAGRVTVIYELTIRRAAAAAAAGAPVSAAGTSVMFR